MIRRQQIADLFKIDNSMATRIELWCDGLTEAAIAERLGISIYAVKKYFERFRKKYKLKNKYEIMMHVAHHLKDTRDKSASETPNCMVSND